MGASSGSASNSPAHKVPPWAERGEQGCSGAGDLLIVSMPTGHPCKGAAGLALGKDLWKHRSKVPSGHQPLPSCVPPHPTVPCRDPYNPHISRLQGPAACLDIPIQHLLSGCEARALYMPGGICPRDTEPSLGVPMAEPTWASVAPEADNLHCASAGACSLAIA